MKKIKSIITDKKGSSSLIYSMAILIFLCLLTLAIIVTIQFRSLALDIQNTAETTLEYYITEQSIENYNSIKNGHSYTASFDENEYIQMLCEALGVDENLKGYTASGRSFEIDNLLIYFANENQLDAMVSFNLIMPVEVCGMEFDGLDTNIVVYGVFESKL